MQANEPVNAKFYLSLSGRPGSPVGGLYEVNGLPARKFKKELIRVGSFTHPTTGVEFVVDANRIDGWVDTFAQMTADGERVTLAASHANTVNDSRGFIDDMFREGDSLYGIVECIGEDSLQAASRTNTSIYAEDVFKSGNGKTYPWAIQHVAMTTKPVIPGLKPFEALAASRGDTQPTQVLSLATGADSMAEITAEPVDVNPKDAVRKSFKTMAMKLWDDESLEPPVFIGKVKELRKKLTDVLAKLGDDEEEEPAEGAEDVVPEGVEVADPVVASHDVVPPEHQQAMVGLMADNRRGKLALSVQAGEITPAASKKLEDMFIGKDNAAIVLSLSHDTPDTFDMTLEAVKAQGASVQVGEKSPGQTLALSNPASGDVENPLVAGAKKMKAAADKRRAGK